MIEVERPEEPDCFKDEKAIKKKKTEYLKIKKNKKCNIDNLWNKLCTNNKYNTLRNELLKSTNNSCCYCGKYINIDDTDIEHYFPKSLYKLVALSFWNYLPSCKSCNIKKSTFTPFELKDKEIIDDILKDENFGYDYLIKNDFENILQLTEKDRFFHIYFDTFNNHFDFDPKTHIVSGRTNIGKITCKRIFVINKGFKEDIQRITEDIKSLIKNFKNENIKSEAYYNLKNNIIDCSYSFFAEKLFDYYEKHYISGNQIRK